MRSKATIEFTDATVTIDPTGEAGGDIAMFAHDGEKFALAWGETLTVERAFFPGTFQKFDDHQVTIEMKTQTVIYPA